MSKQTPTVEWIVAESEADWEHLAAQPSSVNNAALHRKRAWWSISALLFLLVGVSGWLWQTYGVSAPEFEAGWQTYLAVQYGIAPIDQ